MGETLLSVALAALVGAVAWGAGRALLPRLGFTFTGTAERVVLYSGAGLGLLIYSLAVLGGARAYGTASAWGLVGAFGVIATLGARTAATVARQQGYERRQDLSHLQRVVAAGSLVVVVTLAAAYLLVALTPTLEGDSTAGYLVTAREYADAGGIVSVDYAYTDSYPANGQMLSTLGFLLRGQVLAQLLVVWLPGLLALGTIYVLGATWLSPPAALVGMAVWYGTQSVGYLAASAKIDLAWAAFELLAIVAFARWFFAPRPERHWRWLALAGFYLGVAGGIKQASISTTLVLIAAILYRLWRDAAGGVRKWVTPVLALGVPVSVALAWVVRSYAMTGQLGETGGGLPSDSGAAGFLRTIWDMSMLGNTPSTEGPLGKSIGPTILALVPLLVIARGIDHRIRPALGFAGAMLILWFFLGVPRARHLLATLAILAVVAGYVLVRLAIERRAIAAIAGILVLAALGISLGRWTYVNFVSIDRIPYVIGRWDLNEYLAANLDKSPWYPNAAIVGYVRDKVSPGARIAALSSGNGYYLERPFYAGWFETGRDVPRAETLAGRLAATGITHVFVNDFAVEAWGLHDAWLARAEFRDRYLRELICAGGQCLYAFAPAPEG